MNGPVAIAVADESIDVGRYYVGVREHVRDVDRFVDIVNKPVLSGAVLCWC